MHSALLIILAVSFTMQPLLRAGVSESNRGWRDAEHELMVPPLPFCTAPSVLDASGDVFVEIRNLLPGKTAFNRLIDRYQKKKWAELKRDLNEFKREFSSSPLIEGVEFLGLESEMKQIEASETKEITDAEESFRRLLVLYPKSTLIPAVQLSMAKVLLEKGFQSKALALYHQGSKSFPYHDLNCYFMFGEGESLYQLNRQSESQRVFQIVSQKCPKNKFVVGSKLRLLEIQMEKNPDDPRGKEEYQETISKHSSIVHRYFPAAILNMGEVFFRDQQNERALFYMNDYLRSKKMRLPCREQTHKRLADIKLRKGKTTQAIGEYLAIFSESPKSDIGKFSKVIGMLLQAPNVGAAEFQRRQRAIEPEIQEIKNKAMNLNARILQGLSYLKRDSVESLSDLKLLRQSNPSVFNSELIKSIQTSLLGIQLQKSKFMIENPTQKVQKWFWVSTESVFEDWFKRSPAEKIFKEEVSNQVISLFSHYSKQKNLNLALGTLGNLFAYRDFQDTGFNLEQKENMVFLLAHSWLALSEPNKNQVAQDLLKNKALFQRVFGEVGKPLWVMAYEVTGDSDQLRKILGSFAKERRIASKINVSEPYRSISNLLLGRGFSLINEYQQAEKFLVSVNQPDLKNIANQERVGVARQASQFKKAIELGLSSINSQTKEAQKHMLNLMGESVVLGKLWGYGEKIYDISKSIELEPQLAAQILNIRARSFLEFKQYKRAVSFYAESIQTDPKQDNLLETQFYFAKANFLAGDIEEAKKLWTLVIDTKNEFWSPLAENELRILEKP